VKCDMDCGRRAKYVVRKIAEQDCPNCAGGDTDLRHMCGTCLHYDDTCCRMVGRIEEE
jgi:hypothetical protein